MNTPNQPGYFAHPSAIIDEPCQIGTDTKIWHFAHIMSDSRIGESCSLGQNCFVASGVVIGRNVKIQNNVSIYEGVELEDDVFCGPSMVFTNVLNPRSEIVRKGEYRRTIVRRGATIGANATIVCGHEIGAYALIGAGAVVTEDVAPYALMLGVPARHSGWVSRCGHRLEFNGKGVARCPESGEAYQLVNNNTVRPMDRAPEPPIRSHQAIPTSKPLAPQQRARRDVPNRRVTDDRWSNGLTRRSLISKLLLATSILYYLILCWLLMTPSPLSNLPDSLNRILRALDLKDYYHLYLFIPVGFLAASRWVCARGWLDVIAALAFAIGSEVVQVFIRDRDAQVMDLVQNMTGIALGVAMVGISLSFLLMSTRNVLFDSSWARDETRA